MTAPVSAVPHRAGFYTEERRVEIGSAEPLAPGPGEVRIAVAYVGICGSDLHLVEGAMDHRVTFPLVFGHEMSGTVIAIGDGVTTVEAGDGVVVRPLRSCGDCPACRAGHAHICHRLKVLGLDAPGALQETWTVPAEIVHQLPPGTPLDVGALVEPLSVGCHVVRRSEVASGDKAVVLGGGPIGVLVSLLLLDRGVDALLIEVNEARLGLARELGLRATTPDDAGVEEWTGGAGADVVFEVSGAPAAVASATALLRTRGRLVVVAIHPQPRPVDLFRVFWRELDLRGTRLYEPEDYEAAIALVAAGRLPLRSLITSVVPLDALADAVGALRSADPGLKTLVRLGEGD